MNLGGLHPIKLLLLKVTRNTSEILNVYLSLGVNIHHFLGCIRWSFNGLPIRPSGKLVPFKASVTIFGEVETTVYINADIKRGVHLFACVCAYRKCVGLLLHFPRFPSHKASVTCHWITIFLPLSMQKISTQNKLSKSRSDEGTRSGNIVPECVCVCLCVCVCVCVCTSV